MTKKLIGACSAAMLLAAGSASALELYNGDPNLTPNAVLMLDESVQSAEGNLLLSFGPSGDIPLPNSTSVIFITLEGAMLSEPLNGSQGGFEGFGTTLTLSQGNSAGSSEVSLVSNGRGFSGCSSQGVNPASFRGSVCLIRIPVELTGGNVSVKVGMETETGLGIDNTSRSNRKTLELVKLVKPLKVSIEPETSAVIASLASNEEGNVFTSFVGNNILGTVDFDLVENVRTSLDTSSSDSIVSISRNFEKAMLTLSGDFTAFSGEDGAVLLNQDPDGTGGTPFVVNEDKTQATLSLASALGATVLRDAPHSISLKPDGKTSISGSDYMLKAEIMAKAGVEGTMLTGKLQSVERDGASILFPWTQTATQGADSGVISVYRLSNTGDVATGKVCIEVKSSTEEGYDGSAKCPLPSIAAGSEIVWTSAEIEEVVGNYGRGDLEFTVESNGRNLTARQFVVRGNTIQQVKGGTLEQDTN